MLSADDAWKVLREADMVCAETEVRAAVSQLAAAITSRLKDSMPLVLCVMGGGVIFSGQLLPLLRFPLEFDYMHVTRYRGSTRGRDVLWKMEPRVSVKERHVLVLDDILDEGETMAEVKKWLQAHGARSVHIAVFADKSIGRPKPVTADFCGVSVPNRYVFGFGMDINDAWRNLPAIYAIKS